MTVTLVFLFLSRVEGWRYTEWRHWNQTSLEAIWTPDGLYAVELYNHTKSDAAVAADGGGATGCAYDLQTDEVVNVAGEGAGVEAELSERLRKQFHKG